MQLQQLDDPRVVEGRAGKPGPDQDRRLRREGKAFVPLDVIERLDAERVTRQHQPAIAAAARIMQRDGIHAPQPVETLGAMAQIQRQRRLAIRCGAEAGIGQ